MTLLQAVTDSTQTGTATAYDSVWAHQGLPTQTPSGLDAVMLSNDKLYVVLAVVLIIWLGLLFFVFRTDRKLDRLERTLEAGIPQAEE